MTSMEHRPNGTWRVVWRVKGKKQYRTFATEAEARLFADDPFATGGHLRIGLPPFTLGLLERHTPTVVEYAQPLAVDPDLKQGSRDIYHKALRKIEGSQLGETEVAKVTATDVRSFLNELSADRRNVIQFLGKVFNAAVREGIISVSPLVKGSIRRPSQPQKDIRPLTIAEVEKLAAQAGLISPRDALCIRIGAYVGLRGGEVGGLRVEDVDVKASRIHVRQNATTTGLGRQIGELKTRSSRRRLKVPHSLMREIAEYIVANPPRHDGLIFRTDQGNYVTSYTLTRATQRAAARAGMRPVSFHDLRHACASTLIHAGADVKEVQHYLGHASATLTLDTYSHLWPSTDDGLAARIEAMREEYRTGTSA